MTGRGRYAKGVAKREEILQVALEVVAEFGYRKASNREIAERVGLTQPGLTHYFGSREELYIEVLRARDQRDLGEYYAPDPTFEGFLQIVSHNVSVPGLVRLYVEFSAEATIPGHPAREYFTERYDWLRQLLTGMITRAQESGDLGPTLVPTIAVDIIIATADGLQVQWLLDPGVDMVERLSRLWDGIRLASRRP
ncbi:TetR/AcrR family transcriptional regulator [Microbacterium sp. 179-I 3D4 NHS]|uniref:TetR/AcrR family transcriptional regulator n=1 Tax=Microbacterium sp. 179-I 3D4 NHS TaxID=3142381 RepID=UPI0039A3C33B